MRRASNARCHRSLCRAQQNIRGVETPRTTTQRGGRPSPGVHRSLQARAGLLSASVKTDSIPDSGPRQSTQDNIRRPREARFWHDGRRSPCKHDWSSIEAIGSAPTKSLRPDGCARDQYDFAEYINCSHRHSVVADGSRVDQSDSVSYSKRYDQYPFLEPPSRSRST